MVSPGTCAAVLAVCAAAGAIQGISGIGFSMLVMGVMPHFLGYQTATDINRLVGLTMPVVALWKYRSSLRLRTALVPTLVSLVTGTLGILIFTRADAAVLQKLLGVFLLFFVALSIVMDRRQIRIAPTAMKGAAVGLAAGLLSGLFNVLGPILAIYYIAVAEDSGEYRAAINFNFVILCAWMNLFYQARTGYRAEELALAAAGAAGALAATFLVYRFFGAMDRKKMAGCLYAVVAVLAVMMLL